MTTASRPLKALGISWKEITGLVLFYFFFSLLYRLVLWTNGNGFAFGTDNWGWLRPDRYWDGSGRQYAFLLLASVIIWFLGVYLLRKQKMSYQILAIFFLTPTIVYISRELRYDWLDARGITHLTGPAEVWDWYIPTLFLWIQFGVYFAYRYFKENQRKLRIEGELRQAAMKSELAAIKAQLNPHFLYNVFNTINASVPAEQEETREMIATLADLFRYQLQASQQETVPLREELEFVEKYLSLEKARFEDRLKIEVDVPENLLNEQVPPMLLQPLVENSIKHGLASLIDGGSISIRIFKKEDRLHFEIADTGVGIKDKSQLFNTGIGLTNTKLRLEKMYDATLLVMDNDPRGLKITFAI
ncbi:sensor histidine kinase [Croceiramulus getboli]|nr:histidine kinase [Flavobacteriaceae bacterium YJPT1-3]